MKSKPLTICGVDVQPGERVTLALPTPEIYTCAPLHIPMHIVHGKKPGPLVLVCATLYGDEVNGIDMVDRLLNLFVIKKLSGTLLCIPVLNVYGLINHTRFLPDGRDLAKSFPGSETGSFAARLAHLFTKEIVEQMTHCIDIRSGARHTYKLPQTFYHPEDFEAEKMAHAFGAPIKIPSYEKTGFFYGEDERPRIPTIVYEGGEALRTDEYTVKLGLRGITKVLKELGMVRVQAKGPVKKTNPLKAKNRFWIRAPLSGLFHFRTKMGRLVRAGDTLATISDPFGSAKSYDVTSSVDGMIVGLNTHPHVYEGQGIIQMCEFEQELTEEQVQIPPIEPDIIDYGE